MGKGRTEAFSDGVFSFAITLLILDIKVPPLHWAIKSRPCPESSLFQSSDGDTTFLVFLSSAAEIGCRIVFKIP